MSCIICTVAFVDIYPKSVLRYKFFILDTCHPDVLHLSEQGYEDPWLFFKAKKGSAIKKFCKTPF